MTPETRAPLDLREVEARIAAAEDSEREPCERAVRAADEIVSRCIEDERYRHSPKFARWFTGIRVDQEIRAAARQDLPALVEEVKRLREALANLNAHHEKGCALIEPCVDAIAARAALGGER